MSSTVAKLTDKSKEFFQSHGLDEKDVKDVYSPSYYSLFSIYDIDAGVYSDPLMSKNRATAMRVVSDLIPRVPAYSAHANSFKLFCIGGFDTSTGELFFDVKPSLVCNLSDLQNTGTGA